MNELLDKIKYKHMRGTMYLLLSVLAGYTTFHSQDVIDFIGRLLFTALTLLISSDSFFHGL